MLTRRACCSLRKRTSCKAAAPHWHKVFWPFARHVYGGVGPLASLSGPPFRNYLAKKQPGQGQCGRPPAPLETDSSAHLARAQNSEHGGSGRNSAFAHVQLKYLRPAKLVSPSALTCAAARVRNSSTNSTPTKNVERNTIGCSQVWALCSGWPATPSRKAGHLGEDGQRRWRPRAPALEALRWRGR